MLNNLNTLLLFITNRHRVHSLRPAGGMFVILYETLVIPIQILRGLVIRFSCEKKNRKKVY